MAIKKVVQPMDPEWLSEFLSSTKINEKTTACIVAALVRYNQAVYDAGIQFETDLKECVNLHLKK
jgi:hypothetical protein